MESIDKIPKQTVLDILLEGSGAISGLFDFLKVNSLDSLDIPEGFYLKSDVINISTVNFYKAIDNNYRIATAPAVQIQPSLNGAYSNAYSNAYN